MQATPAFGLVKINTVETLPNGVMVLIVGANDYDAFSSLPAFL